MLSSWVAVTSLSEPLAERVAVVSSPYVAGEMPMFLGRVLSVTIRKIKRISD